MFPDEGSIYPPPVLRKDIMKLQLFMGCFARKRVRHDSTNSSNGNSKKITNPEQTSSKRKTVTDLLFSSGSVRRIFRLLT